MRCTGPRIRRILNPICPDNIAFPPFGQRVYWASVIVPPQPVTELTDPENSLAEGDTLGITCVVVMRFCELIQHRVRGGRRRRSPSTLWAARASRAGRHNRRLDERVYVAFGRWSSPFEFTGMRKGKETNLDNSYCLFFEALTAVFALLFTILGVAACTPERGAASDNIMHQLHMLGIHHQQSMDSIGRYFRLESMLDA